MNNIYPWQQKQYNNLLAAVNNNYIPKALLLTGEAWSGVFEFAAAASQLFNCKKPNYCTPANLCVNCHKLHQGNNFNFKFIQTTDSSISIDEIRAVLADVYHTPLDDQYNIIVISPIEKMSASAINALLKTLEEPPQYTIFVMVSYYLEMVPETIKSRALKVFLPSPSMEMLATYCSKNNIHCKQELLINNVYNLKNSLDEITELDNQFLDFVKYIALECSSIDRVLTYLSGHDFIAFLRYFNILVVQVIRIKLGVVNHEQDLCFGEIKKIADYVAINDCFVASRLSNKLLYEETVLNIRNNPIIIKSKLVSTLFPG